MNTLNEVIEYRDGMIHRVHDQNLYALHQRRRSLHQVRVEEFMLKAEQPVRLKPAGDYFESPDSVKERELRAKLILEEALEQVRDLGFQFHAQYEMRPVLKPDFLKFVDNCADQSVVTIGSLSQFGVPDLRVLEIVDSANLRKFNGGHRRPDGKWMKPANWVGPEADLKRFLLGV